MRHARQAHSARAFAGTEPQWAPARAGFPPAVTYSQGKTGAKSTLGAACAHAAHHVHACRKSSISKAFRKQHWWQRAKKNYACCTHNTTNGIKTCATRARGPESTTINTLSWSMFLLSEPRGGELPTMACTWKRSNQECTHAYHVQCPCPLHCQHAPNCRRTFSAHAHTHAEKATAMDEQI